MTDSESIPSVIVRHYKERLSKCSLHGLENRADLRFLKFPRSGELKLPDVTGYVTLALDAEPLSKADAGRGLVLIDGTWRYAERMARALAPQLEGTEPRSIPQGFKTGYPRRQTLCPDPEAGLASVEALYIAHLLMGKDVEGLLDGYHWREEFLGMNEDLLGELVV
jgi:pre-rRNA-processing protein TSR3